MYVLYDFIITESGKSDVSTRNPLGSPHGVSVVAGGQSAPGALANDFSLSQLCSRENSWLSESSGSSASRLAS